MRGTSSPKTSVGVNLKMVSVNEVCQVLQQLAPLSSAESWDNVGLLLGRAERPVNRIMTCLTLTPNVAFEAIGRNVQMIVTHHPVMFRAVKSITGETLEGRLLLDLIEAGIAVYSPHTAFDNADEGINQWLAESFGLELIEPLRPFAAGIPGGSGRVGIFQESLSRKEFLEKVAAVIGAEYMETAWHGTENVRRVGLACGSAAEYLTDALRSGCDTFVTGEARFHSAVECQSRGVNLVLMGHYRSERPAVVRLASLLSARLGEVECFSSEHDQNPLRQIFG